MKDIKDQNKGSSRGLRFRKIWRTLQGRGGDTISRRQRGRRLVFHTSLVGKACWGEKGEYKKKEQWALLVGEGTNQREKVCEEA